ncbi:MAG: sec-independent translocase [Micropruina sp.]|uniref:sec-independent translocase n=1 Tax=Micropruina sp. TaxID=2737536 RepID=UPI0039E4EF45
MDFNASEIVLLLVLAIILFGPEKLPELARKAARVLHYVRRIANDAQGRLREELGPEYADLQLSDLNPKAFIAKHLGPDATAELDSVAAEVRGARSSLDDAIAGGPETDPDQDDDDVPDAERPVPPFDAEAT